MIHNVEIKKKKREKIEIKNTLLLKYGHHGEVQPQAE